MGCKQGQTTSSRSQAKPPRAVPVIVTKRFLFAPLSLPEVSFITASRLVFLTCVCMCVCVFATCLQNHPSTHTNRSLQLPDCPAFSYPAVSALPQVRCDWGVQPKKKTATAQTGLKVNGVSMLQAHPEALTIFLTISNIEALVQSFK